MDDKIIFKNLVGNKRVFVKESFKFSESFKQNFAGIREKSMHVWVKSPPPSTIPDKTGALYYYRNIKVCNYFHQISDFLMTRMTRVISSELSKIIIQLTYRQRKLLSSCSIISHLSFITTMKMSFQKFFPFHIITDRPTDYEINEVS